MLASTAGLALAAPAAALQQKVTAADGVADDNLGHSVAVDGDTMVAGAPRDDNTEGAVYVFQRSGDSWAQTAKLTASDGFPDSQLGFSVAIDGDTIVAGARFADTDGVQDFTDHQGAVYTFARTGGPARTETAKLTASDGAEQDQLGSSVAIDGDTIVAGAAGARVANPPGGLGGQGAVYTFASTGASLRPQTAKLTASDSGQLDGLGISVAIDGDTIVAGAPNDDTSKGSAYTFARTGADRSQTAKLTASDGASTDVSGLGDRLGFSVAIDGDTIVAGAPNDDAASAVDQGSAYTFARTGGNRNEIAKLTASDGMEGDGLGLSTRIDGDTIIAGADFGDGIIVNTGAVYTFARAGLDPRVETGKLTAADGAAGDHLGFSAAIDGETIVAGAPFDTVNGNAGRGSAVAFFSPGSPDTDDPETTIDSGPSGPTTDPTPTFSFSSDEGGSTFECRIDSGDFSACTSPHTTATLADGAHTFQVRATDGAGNTDPSVASRALMVDLGPSADCVAAKADLANAQKQLTKAKSKQKKATTKVKQAKKSGSSSKLQKAKKKLKAAKKKVKKAKQTAAAAEAAATTACADQPD